MPIGILWAHLLWQRQVALNFGDTQANENKIEKCSLLRDFSFGMPSYIPKSLMDT